MDFPAAAKLPDEVIPLHSARWAADLLEIWRYCTHATCRRAHRCRGDGCRCIRLHTYRVPPHFYRSAKAIIDAHIIRETHAERRRGA